MTQFDDLEIVIRRKTGRAIAGIPQLRLYGRGKDATEALARLDQKKQALIDDLTEVGELESLEIPPPSRRATVYQQASSGNLEQFFLKAVIVVVLIGTLIAVPGVIVAHQLAKTVDRAIVQVQTEKQKIKELSGPAFWRRLESELDRAADPKNAMPEEKKQKILANIRSIVTQWRPFVQEAGGLFEAPPAGTPANPPPSR